MKIARITRRSRDVASELVMSSFGSVLPRTPVSPLAAMDPVSGQPRHTLDALVASRNSCSTIIWKSKEGPRATI